MIDFLIIALPRSRTAWLSNFLTTDKTFCFHEPLAMATSHKDLLELKSDRITGAADTGIGYFDLAPFTCKKLIIERDVSYVNARMSHQLGMNVDMSDLDERIKKLDGFRVKFEEIDYRLEEIWDFCTGLPYDRLRAEYLKNMNVQIMNLPVDPAKIALLRKEIHENI